MIKGVLRTKMCIWMEDLIKLLTKSASLSLSHSHRLSVDCDLIHLALCGTVPRGVGAVTSFHHGPTVKRHNDFWWGRLKWGHIRIFRHIWSKINLSALASHLQGSTPEDGIDGLFQNVGKKSTLTLCVKPQNSVLLLGAIVWTYLSAIVSWNLAERFITVDNWEIDDLSVGQ